VQRYEGNLQEIMSYMMNYNLQIASGLEFRVYKEGEERPSVFISKGKSRL